MQTSALRVECAALTFVAALMVAGFPPVVDAGDVLVDSLVPTITLDDTESDPGTEWLVRTTNNSEFLNIFSNFGGKNIVRIAPSGPEHTLYLAGWFGNANVGLGGIPDAGVSLDIQGELGANLQLRATDSGRRWLLSASETTFSISDATGGLGATVVPFVIGPGAPTDSLVVSSQGNLGIGTDAPLLPLHVVRTTATAARIAQFTQTKELVLVGYENAAAASLTREVGFDFVLRTNTQPRVAARIISGFTDITDATRQGQMKFLAANGGAFVEAFRVKGNRVGINQTNPTALLQVQNATCNGTTWADASSRTLKHGIVPLSTESARDTVMALEPVTFAYNQQPDDQRLGFIAEDVPEAVAMPGRETLSGIDIVAALTRVVQEQERQLAGQARENAEQRTVIEALAARLAAIESREE